jgi:hypothetical protein
MKTTHLLLALWLLISCRTTSDQEWPAQSLVNQPGTRWWWLGSAVDREGLTANMEQLHASGIGTLEITPIYGIRGSEHRHIDYLSPVWMDMYSHVIKEGQRLNMKIDMSTGSGWPFGGPEITPAHAATKVIFQTYKLQGGCSLTERIIVKDSVQASVATLAVVMAYGEGKKLDITSHLDTDGTLHWQPDAGDWTVWAVFNGKTLQRVKRAAPGGKGLVLNHFSKEAVTHYLQKFESAFTSSGAEYPHTFFGDSYEVYGADWSEELFTEFERLRGYRLQDYLPELNREGDAEISSRVICDYRETLSDMLLHNFTIPWTSWAHRHGSLVRNQAHGSPGNLIDLYASVDIPECESFGRTRFDIPGLRIDSGMKESDSHPFVLKYASSASHITGKRYTSSETFTWLTEHFRASLSQLKPELDLLFLSGVNRMFYHGSTYSPADVPWPGWMFYATVNMNATNPIFRDVKGLNDYITRTQSFLQEGEPDNDFLLYLPLHDIWQQYPSRLLLFSIHQMSDLMPDFAGTVSHIQQCGYDLDYISDRYIQELQTEHGLLRTTGATYKAIIVPNVHYIPHRTFEKLLTLAREGATVVFTDRLPEDVPGLHKLEERRRELERLRGTLPFSEVVPQAKAVPYGKGKMIIGKDQAGVLEMTAVRPEKLYKHSGAQLLRRKHKTGYLYFIAMLQNRTIDGYVPLGTACRSAALYNPLTGAWGKAHTRQRNGESEVYLQLEPGQSILLKTWTDQTVDAPRYPIVSQGDPVPFAGDWQFEFTDGEPSIAQTFRMKGSPVNWTELPNDTALRYAGTGRYSISFDAPSDQSDGWLLRMDHLHESARVYLNDRFAGIVWSLPYTIEIGDLLIPGRNHLTIDVTNPPANRIRDLDRRHVDWRIFHDINVVSVFYKDIRFDSWDISPSGLSASPVLIPLKNDTI